MSQKMGQIENDAKFKIQPKYQKFLQFFLFSPEKILKKKVIQLWKLFFMN